PSTFYDLPSNYPPSPSQHGHHRCLCGMGTPDVRGTYGTYQAYGENYEPEGGDHPGGKQIKLVFDDDTAKASLVGPANSFLKDPQAAGIDFLIHRDRHANAAVIQIQGQRILLKAGQWSRWTRLDFVLTLPWFLPDKKPSGICRFYL